MKVFLRKQVLTFSGLCLLENLRGGVLRREKMDLWLRLGCLSVPKAAQLSPLGTSRVNSHNGWRG